MKRIIFVFWFCLALQAPLIAGADRGSILSPKALPAILVTGASSGIGKAIAELAAQSGYFVFAGVRKSQDVQNLSTTQNILPLQIDVTSQPQIDRAVKKIQESGYTLVGIVNNAGASTLGKLIDVDEKEMDLVFGVNVYGPIRMVKSFYPLLKKSKGRVVNIGSVAGIASAHSKGVYSMSKHALEAFNDALREEVKADGITVILIEPGSYKSELGKTTVDRLNLAGVKVAGIDQSNLKEPDEVAAAVLDAISSKNPKRRYLVTPTQEEADYTLRSAIQKLSEMNERHQYALQNNEIITLLIEETQKNATLPE